MTDVNAEVSRPPAPTEESSSSSQLQRIGGNTDLEHAKVIILGEKHADFDAPDQLAIGEFLGENARPDDVLLIEGEARGTSVDPFSFRLIRYLNIPDFMKVKGWCDPSLEDAASAAKRKLALAQQFAAQQEKLGHPTAPTFRQVADQARVEFDEVAIVQRNKSLMASINDEVAQGAGRVFVIAGHRHYTDDPALQEFLGKMQYIAYKVDAPAKQTQS
jgi:hypothetical protein